MKQAVTRTRESFSESISSVIALTREVDESTLNNLEPILLSADLGAPTTALVLENLRQRALRTGIQGGTELKQLLRSELKAILDGVARPINHPATPPEVVMMVGVNGTGKTTTSGKLANFYRGQSRTVLLCAADTFRAAAIEQLEVWARRSDVDIIKTKQGGDPFGCALRCLYCSQGSWDTGVDRGYCWTIAHQDGPDEGAGQDAANRGEAGSRRSAPDAAGDGRNDGQNGLTQARLFTEAAHVTGIVLTKLDGTAKGGIVLAIATELKLPVVYAGIGEKIEDLIPFDSSSFVDSLLD